ncbi:MAG: methyltransferase domain-containing protein, partial [Thiomargarita sp.]|nr:methyltransferase domain-containing protein [Thiomargarita sp.]
MQHTNFTFPLNVYAHALHLEEGYFNYLHYGFNVEQGIHKAQQNSTDFIITQLPPAPASILEVGIGIGTTAKQLVKLGYDYTGVVPDPAQITYCNDKQLNLIESNFEALSSTKQYDIILFQESAQYIASNILLEKAYTLLKPKAYLLILDEIATESITKLTTLANQIGFEVMAQNDFTAKASPSIAY